MRQCATFRFRDSGHRSAPAMPYETPVGRQLSYNYLRGDTKGHRSSMRKMRGWLTVLIVAAAVSLLLPSRSHALTPDRDIAQYAHHSWKIEDGYFGSNPYSLAQDNDGYLWVGTNHGLYRYDGDRFLRWNPPAGTHLPGSSIEGLLADRDGSLWIGTEAGLAHLSGGHLMNYFENVTLRLLKVLRQYDLSDAGQTQEPVTIAHSMRLLMSSESSLATFQGDCTVPSECTIGCFA
jgi:hypothetical protein